MTLEVLSRELKETEAGRYHISEFALRIMAPSAFDQVGKVMNDLMEDNPDYVFHWIEEPTGGYTISWRRESSNDR